MRAGTIETSKSDATHDVVHVQNDRSHLGPLETCYSVQEVAVLRGKTTGKGWNPYSLDTLVLKTQLCMLKTTDEVWDPYRLSGVVLKSLFCMH